MAIVRPTVSTMIADPRAPREEAKWNAIHANTARIASMVPQAMLQQYAIDESLKAQEQREAIKAGERELAAIQATMTPEQRDVDLFGYDAQTMGGTAGLPASTPPRTVLNQQERSNMLAQGSPMGAQADMMSERLAKMERFQALAERDGQVVSNRNFADEDRRTAAAMQAFDPSPMPMARAQRGIAASEARAQERVDVAAANQMLSGLSSQSGARTPVATPDLSGAAPFPARQTPDPTIGSYNYQMPDVMQSRADEYINAQIMATPGLRMAIEDNEMVADAFQRASNEERMLLIQEIKRKIAEAKTFGEQPHSALSSPAR